MAWRGLHLSRPARLSLADSQVVIAQEDGEVRLPLEDVAWIILDVPHATLTSTLLSACMSAGVVIIATDDRHVPSGVVLPFHQHFRQSEVAHRQIEMSAPLKKRLWQSIVQTKITNQATALALAGADGAKTLLEMARHVGSGDPDNVEARAARFYWSRLFTDFRRDDGTDLRNSLLNYGYAVIRSGIARALVAHGLMPTFGIHHASVTNAFNLADDLMEPFRPFVDLLARTVVGTDAKRAGDLTVEDRRAMAGVLFQTASLNGETVTLLVATEHVAESLIRVIEVESAQVLQLPLVAAGNA